MLVLVLDCATAAVTAGLVRVDPTAVTVLAERVTVDSRRHGEALAPGLRGCLADAGARIADVAAVVAGVGPGPFTGLRVGLVTAAALADARDLPAYGVSSLDAVAHAAGAGTPLLVAADARRREVYWAAYNASGRRVEGPSVGTPAAVRDRLDTADDPPRRVAGAGGERYADVLRLDVVWPAFPTVAGLAALAADRVRAGAAAERLAPVYLRRPDAVEPVARKPVVA